MNQLQRPTDNMAEILTHYSVKNPSAIFVEAVGEGSNRERDWLWYAEQVSGDAERRYCLERSLYINRNSREARQQLVSLSSQTANSRRASTHRLGRFFLGWKRAAAQLTIAQR